MTFKEFSIQIGPRTDKEVLGYYDEFYDKLFSPRQHSTTNVLELGVGSGGSITTWRDFFTNAQIYGMDINDCNFVDKSRITFMQRDGYTIESANLFQNNFFDIVIDDGPHSYESMVFFLKNYLPKVKSGGILVLEDIVDPTWTPSLLELIDPCVGATTVWDMRNKQKSENYLNAWKNGLDVITLEKF